MKVKVNKDLCIGCGACAAIAGSTFEIDDDGLAKAVTPEVAKEVEEEVTDAVESCPTGAIESEKEESK